MGPPLEVDSNLDTQDHIQQISVAFEFPVLGNLWFVQAIGCNVEPKAMVEQTIHFPQTAKENKRNGNLLWYSGTELPDHNHTVNLVKLATVLSERPIL